MKRNQFGWDCSFLKCIASMAAALTSHSFLRISSHALAYYWKCTRNDDNLKALIFHKGRWKTLGISALLPHVRLQQILHLSFSQRPGNGIIHIICKNDVDYAIHLREKLSIRLTKIEYVNSFFGNLTAFMKKRTLLTFSCISNVYFFNQLVQSLHLE